MAVTPPPVVQVQPMQIQHHLDISSVQCAVTEWFSNVEHMLIACAVGVVLGVLGMLWYNRAGSVKGMVTEVKSDVGVLKQDVTKVKEIVTPTTGGDVVVHV